MTQNAWYKNYLDIWLYSVHNKFNNFYCGSCMIHFMFDTNKLTLEQASYQVHL